MKLQKYRVYYTYTQIDVYEIEAGDPHTAEEHASEKGVFLFETREFVSADAIEEN
jgi:hypothetical protein